MIHARVFVLLLMTLPFANAQDMPLTQVLIDGEDWELVADGLTFADGFASDTDGNFYFADVLGGTTINCIDLDGKQSVVVDDVPRISGLQFGPDDRLYACQGGQTGRIMAFDLANGQREVIVEGVKPNDLVVTTNGDIYLTETPKRQITRVPSGSKEAIAVDVSDGKSGLGRPNGITLTPDGGTLAVSDTGGRYAWVWRIESDGTLSFRQPYITLRTPAPDAPSKGDGMTTDLRGRFYVTSAVGIQMFDPTGRMGGVIAAPTEKPVVSIAFAGPELSWLYAAAGDRIYRRKTKTKGFP